jgi:DNA repair protein RadD
MTALFTPQLDTDNAPPMTLRPYQDEAVQAAVRAKNGIIVLPTGSGKSLVIAGIVNATAGRTLVLQPSKEILESNYDKICRSGFTGASIFSASMGIKRVGRCTYATIGSIIHKLELFADVETVIIDECHLVNAKGGQYERLIKTLSPPRLIGLSATPYRLHTTSLGSDIRMLHRTRPKLFDDILFVVQTGDLARDGFLHQPKYMVSGQDSQQILQLNTTGAEFSDASIDRYLNQTHIVERVADAAEDAITQGRKHLLVFLPSIAQSDRAVELLNDRGIRASIVTGETESRIRDSRLKDFRNGHIRAIVNVGVLTTGYDFPALDCVICGRPTQSLSLYYQIIGRCVRPHPSKSEAVVYDLVDNFSRFGDPFSYRIVASAPGLHSILCSHGRLNNRIIGSHHECHDRLEFGKYQGKRLCTLPNDYIEWCVRELKPSKAWHQLRFEQLRRQLFFSHQQNQGGSNGSD